jgi:hypothetical protein
MNPAVVTDAAGNILNARDVAGVACAFLVIVLVLLGKLYMDKRTDDKAHAAALEKKDQDLLAIALKQAGTSAEQSMLMAKLVDRSKP